MTASSSSSPRKSNERARNEHHIEKLFGDWRLFRATLVTNEKQRYDYPTSSLFYFANHHRRRRDDDAILFNHDGIGEPSCSDPFATSPAKRLAVLNDYSSLEKDSVLSLHHPRQQNSRQQQQQWAHPLSHIEQGCVLIATDHETMMGGIFRQKVILVTHHYHHGDRGVTKGIIINRPFRGTLGTLSRTRRTSTTNPIENDPTLRRTFATSYVYYGGPVNTHNETLILHNHAPLDESITIVPGLYFGGRREALLQEVQRGYLHPSDSFFVKGCVQWRSSRELMREVEEGLWYVAAVSLDYMLPHKSRRRQRYDGGDGGGGRDDMTNDDLWYDILMCLGGEYAVVAERHRSNRR